MLTELRAEKSSAKKDAPAKAKVPVAVRRQPKRQRTDTKPAPVQKKRANVTVSPKKKAAPVQPESVPAQEAAKPQPRKQRYVRLRDAAVGLVLLVFAGIGIWSAAARCLAAYRAKKDNSAQLAAVRQCILPLALMDMPSFESPDELTDEQFLTAAVWALIADGGLADYPTDTNLCTVPASAVAAAGNARFGTSRQPEYKTIGFTDLLRFYYDADQQCYLLPADPRFFGNLPEIGACKRTSDGLYAVSAVYRPEQPVWYQTEAPVVRHAELTMRQDAESWQILSLKTDAPEPDAEASEETND